MLSRIKKKDTVQVMTGKDKDKQGAVLEIKPLENKVIVKGVNMVTRHIKPRRQGESGSIKKQEASITLSNVMPVCTSCKKPCRVQAKVMDNGTKARVCHRCKEVF